MAWAGLSLGATAHFVYKICSEGDDIVLRLDSGKKKCVGQQCMHKALALKFCGEGRALHNLAV